ncbi:GNAT family N-acetyltransferase [Neisseriaceae bacterium TC5R-5]|nr:GNAT family N-acetyltransferase [Neisseriaceae bacterium TC5R-5]
MLIRDAGEADVAAILVIYNEVIATSTAIYNDDPFSCTEFSGWFCGRVAAGLPILVAEHDGKVVGFASFAPFRERPGFRFTVEHSVHLTAEARGQQVGSALMQVLFARAQALGKHVMVGAVDAENEASIRFHEKLGFVQTGVLRQIGFKFDRWLDLIYLQKYINE